MSGHVLNRRGGFTLVELIVAAALSAVVIAGVWLLLGTYERLFNKGQVKVEQAQLVRALLEQIAADLRSAIPDTATGLPGAATSIRRFGLFGSERALQVDVLQPTIAQAAATAQTVPAGGAFREPSSEHTAQVPELHTIQYWLEEPAESPTQGVAAPRGLVRRELGWDAPPGGAPLGAPGAKGPARTAAGLPGAAAAASDGDAAIEPDFDPRVLRVPEVVGLEFRYFDGANWSGQWSSLDRKSLPLAIEVILKMKRADADTASVSRPARKKATGDEEPDKGEVALAATRDYRLLVHLPSTALAPAKAAEPDARRAPVAAAPDARRAPVAAAPRVPVFRPAPPAGSSRASRTSGPSSLPLPDEWIRTEK